MTRPPAHLVPAGVPEHHGVARCARELAAELGAEVVTEPPASGGRVHLHVTDRLLGRTPEAAAAAVRRLCRRAPTTVTLHDVPQPSDGAGFARRAAAYATVLEHAAGWVACSHHERALVAAHSGGGAGGTVIPLPVARPLPPPPITARAPDGGPPVIAILGWIYPGKGHREVLEAAAALDRPVQVVALGGVTSGHEAVACRLRARAERLGIGFSVTGSLDDDAMTLALRTAAVGVSAHRNLSASASINTWIAAGRRPLVRDGGYAREMAGLRPGTITVFEDDDLTPALAAALADPGGTVLGRDAVTTPHVAEVAAAYAAWWGPPSGG